jgi:WD40 repeat protein
MVKALVSGATVFCLWTGLLNSVENAVIRPLGEAMVHPAEVHGIALSSDGKWAATGASDNNLRIWNTTTGTLHRQPREHDGAVYPVAFSPDSRLVVAGTQGGAKLWDVASGTLLATFPHKGFVYAVVFRSDGGAMLAGSHDGPNEGTAQMWDIRTGQPIGEAVHQRFYAVAFSPDGKLAACSGNGNAVQLLDGMTGKLLPVEIRHEGSVRSLSFGLESKRLLTGSLDKTGRVWDVVTGKPISPPLVHKDQVRTAVFDPRGTSVLTGAADGMAQIWDAVSGKPLTPPLVHPTGVRCSAFSPDGRFVATGCYGNTAHVWDAKTGSAVGEPIQHGGLVRAVGFGPDSRVLLTGSFDKTARLWRIEYK